MRSMKNWLLGAIVVAGLAGVGATSAQAAEFGVYVHGPVAYAHPSPGPGYELVAGYRNHGYRAPERRAFVDGRGPVARYDRGFDRDRGFHRGFDRDRRFDRDHFRR